MKQFLSYRMFSSVENADKTPITNFLKYNLIVVSLYKDINECKSFKLFIQQCKRITG